MPDNALPAAFGYGLQNDAVTSKWRVQCDPREEFRKMFPAFVESKMLVYEDGLYPDEVRHWSDIRMRPYAFDNSIVVGGVCSTGLQESGTAVPFNPRWMDVYARWRCTMRYTIGYWEGETNMAELDLWKMYLTGPAVSSRTVNFAVIAGTERYNRHFVVETPRWRTTNYDSRLKVDTASESFQVQTQGGPVLIQAGDSTVGFMPMGLLQQI